MGINSARKAQKQRLTSTQKARILYVKGCDVMAPAKAENTVRVPVLFSPSIADQLKEAAKERGMSVSGLVRMIVMEWLKAVSKDD